MYVTEDELAKLYPFYFFVEANGAISAIGPSLNRYLDESNLQQSLFHHFQFISPAITGFEELLGHLNQVFIIQPRQKTELSLRGQFLELKEEGLLLFAGSPWADNFKSLEELGISREDFALCEPITHFLMVMEAQQTSLEKSEDSAKELSKENAMLEKRVQRRTARLTEINEELIQSQEKLQQEMAHRETMEVEQRFSQKMEALGQLSAGIAHEINTPIQFVGDSIFFLKESIEDLQRGLKEFEELVDKKDSAKVQRIAEINEMLDLDYLSERIPESIDRASQGIARVSEIIQAMKSFTRSESKQKALADINTAIESTLLVAGSEYKYNAQVDKDFGDIPQIYCYISDLSQVLLNMIVNSAHAIEERFGSTPADIVGKIALTTRKVDNDIVITIWDNGSGIPSEVIDKIYDPFFTTKQVGKGTGQGLALVHRIICDGHNGKINVSSADNEGTQFEIILPILESPDIAETTDEST